MIKASEKENALISENALTAYGRWGSNRNSTYLAEPLRLRASIFAAITKSLSVSPSILCVQSVILTLPQAR